MLGQIVVKFSFLPQTTNKSAGISILLVMLFTTNTLFLFNLSILSSFSLDLCMASSCPCGRATVREEEYPLISKRGTELTGVEEGWLVQVVLVFQRLLQRSSITDWRGVYQQIIGKISFY